MANDTPNATFRYIEELRTCLLHCLICVGAIFCLSVCFANRLFDLLAAPMVQQLHGSSLIATSLFSPFLTPLKMCFYLAICLSVPFIFYKLWHFITPALYPKERKQMWPFLTLSIFLFYAGALFSWLFVLPKVLSYFIRATPHSVTLMPDMGHYLNFVAKVGFTFGLGFEIPLFTFAAVEFNWLSLALLRGSRPGVIVAAFVLGMFLTPPDVLSQIVVAVPLWALFELGLALSTWRQHTRKRQQDSS